MEELGKYDRIEGRLDDMDDRLRNVEISMAGYQEITKRNTEVLEKFSDTLETVSKTMCDIAYNTKQNTDVVNSLSQKVDGINNEVGKLNEKVNEVDDKTKVDTAVIVKDWLLKLIIGGGSFAGIIYLIQLI